MTDAQARLTTEELAERMRTKPYTVRARLSRTGSYFGIRPAKAPNGRLLWPADAPERLIQMPSEEAAA